MKRIISLMLWAFCCLFCFIGCTDKDEDMQPEPALKKTNRTVLAYIVGDMDLWHLLEESINQMEEGWDETIDGTLLVYLDDSPHLTQFGQPVLLEITHDETDMIVSKVVKTYPDQDAGAPDVMQGVLNDAITLYPAESHGLIIAAHSNGWIPEYTVDSRTRGITGSERYGSTLEIDELARILPLKYDFILFHACNMSNVETAYQLRNKCEYLMGSVFSLPGFGYPYDQIIPHLFTKPKADLYKACWLSYLEYETKIDPAEFEAFSVEVIKTSELENLAAVTSKFLDDLNMSYDEMSYELYREREEVFHIPAPDNNYVIDFSGNTQLLLDLKGITFLMEDDEKSKALEAALNKVIIQHYVVGQTPNAIKMKTTKLGSGLSFYLPRYMDHPVIEQLNSKFINNYEWAKASGFAKVR